ncbi:MAG TPA: hypothetical protein VGM84_26265 [Steroidobacteraceae bacterium]|jgi:hypothetical protein
MSIPPKVLEAAGRAIAEALAHGQVGDGGVGDHSHQHFNREEVATVLLFLAAGPVKELRNIPHKLHETSYTWKHRAERWGRVLGLPPYVSNGAFIIAADWLGVPSRRSPNSPNVFYALRSLRDDVGQGVNHEFGDPTWERKRDSRTIVRLLGDRA